MKMKKTALKSAAGVSANVMARLGKDEYISLESIEKICVALNCSVDDILEFISDDNKKNALAEKFVHGR
jgi:DNA-binding Xre family transcriptional regulator